MSYANLCGKMKMKHTISKFEALVDLYEDLKTKAPDIGFGDYLVGLAFEQLKEQLEREVIRTRVEK